MPRGILNGEDQQSGRIEVDLLRSNRADQSPPITSTRSICQWTDRICRKTVSSGGLMLSTNLKAKNRVCSNAKAGSR